MCNITKFITKILVIIGALNWGLVGFFEYNLVAQVFGGGMGEEGTGARVVFALVGLAGLCALFCCLRSCCGKGACHCDCGCKSCNKKK